MTKTTSIFLLVLWTLNLLPNLTFAGGKAPPISCMAIPALFQAFLRTHVSNPDLTSTLEDHTADQFIKRIDGSKTILLASDVEKIKPSIKRFFKNIKNPDCTDLDSIRNLLIDRTKDQLEFAKQFLGDTYKLDENVEIIIDPEKREYPKTAAEAHQKQITQMHFQISNYLMTDMKLPESRKQLVHRYELAVKRMEELSNSDVYDHLINSFAQALDPHSSYMSPEVLEDFQIQMGLSLEGIGASLSPEDGYTVIQELIPGGAASRSKLLEAKDKIIAVGQGNSGPMENVIDMDLRDVVQKIRGKAGSTVRLTILRTGKEVERFNVSLVRSKVNLEDDAAKIDYFDKKIDGKKVKFARIDLPSFYGDNTLKERSCSHDIAKLLAEAKKKKVAGIVLDFSQNGGGRLEEAVRIAGLFIKKGNVVATKDSRGEIIKLDDTDPSIQYNGPLVVLTSRGSASASEIVAGALQDYGRAVIIGSDHTFGKGSVQAVLPLQNDFGAIKVTTGLFYIPGGNSTQHKGVNADVMIPSLYATDDLGEKFLDYSLKPDAITPFVSKEAYSTIGEALLKNAVEKVGDLNKLIAAANDKDSEWVPVTKEEISRLRENSKKRIDASKEFSEIQKELKETMDKKGVVKLADMRKKETDRKKKDGDKKKSPKQLAKEKSQPLINEAIDIVADLYQLRTSHK